MQVEVRGDIENGIRILRNILRKDGIHDEVRRRLESPNRTDRKKVKVRVARRRRLKTERRKEWTEQHREQRRFN